MMITDLGVMNFANTEREMQLSALYPGVKFEDVQKEVGWPLRSAEKIEVMEPPAAEELRLIREEIDPTGMYR